MFDIAKHMAQTLVNHGVRQGIMTPVSESPNGCVDKQKSRNKKKRQSTQDPSNEQTVVVHAATTPTTSAPGSRYVGTLQKCNKCNLHHTGACQKMYCKNCLSRGHTIRICKAPARPNFQVPYEEVSQTCYECGETRHYRIDCPLTRNPGEEGRVLMITTGENTPELPEDNNMYSKLKHY